MSTGSDTTGRVIATLGPKRLADAITSPSSLLLAGAVGGVAVAATGPLGLVAGVVAWLGATLFKLRPSTTRIKKQPARIDPFAIGEPWRRYVQSAQQSKLRFERAAAATTSPIIRTRLFSLSERVDEAVTQCWTVAQRANQLDITMRGIDLTAIRREIADAQNDVDRNNDPTRAPLLASTLASLKAQLASAERMRVSAVSTEDKLRELDAKLDELVARGTEISVSATSEDDFGTLGSDVDGVVTEMEALRQAMDETSAINRGISATG